MDASRSVEGRRGGAAPGHGPRRPPLRLQTTTLWYYPSQHYGRGLQGDPRFRGATPSYILWNLLQRYTKPRDLVVDPMAGSGTTLDVARELGRRAVGYDLAPARKDVFRADARKLPLEDEKADFIFCDPPYGTHVRYSGRAECIGELDARGAAYFDAMEQVFVELQRILRPERFLAVLACDSWSKKGFVPIGARFSEMLARRFTAVDHVAVVRGSKDLDKPNYHKAAAEQNFFLRGFSHLLLFYKEGRGGPGGSGGPSGRGHRRGGQPVREEGR